MKSASCPEKWPDTPRLRPSKDGLGDAPEFSNICDSNEEHVRYSTLAFFC